MISIIVAIDQKRGIGKNNDLLFHIPGDFKRMHKVISGHPLVMGRKTFASIGRVIPSNTSIIITSNADYQLPDFVKTSSDKEKCVVVHSLEEGIEVAKKSSGSDEIFVFGGGQIFKEAMEKNLVDRLYLTVVDADFNADTFFPDYSKFTKVLETETRNDWQMPYTFLTLEK